MKQPPSISKLTAKFNRLPSVGIKTAQRYAYAIINMSTPEVEDFARAIVDAKRNVKYCSVCGNFTETEICDVCRNRDSSVICVVAYPKDTLAIEKGGYTGVYHVLHGTISPLEGRGADDIRIKELLGRLNGVKEVIMATNPDVEGEATALYVAKLLSPLGVKVTRLAQGISAGTDIEYADELTLTKALSLRTPIN